MSISLLFAVILIFWGISILSGWPPGKPWVSNVVLFVLFVILGWAVFGPLIHR